MICFILDIVFGLIIFRVLEKKYMKWMCVFKIVLLEFELLLDIKYVICF